MSLFQFLGSDRQLAEKDNPYLEFISFNEAVERGVEMPDFFDADDIEDKDEKNILYCESEEQLEELTIQQEMDGSEEYAEEYSSKSYFSEIQWRYTPERCQQLVDYLKEQIEHVPEIEVWSIWLDEHKPARIRMVQSDKLTVSDLSFLAFDEGTETPECLVVKK